MPKRTVFQRLRDAAVAGTGARITAEEVRTLLKVAKSLRDFAVEADYAAMDDDA